MQLRGHDIAVCSWSLRIFDPKDLAASLRSLGLSHLHLGVGPMLEVSSGNRRTYGKILRDAGIAITSTMIGFPGEDYATISSIRETGGFDPDALWPRRREMTLAAGQVTRELGVDRLSTHIGFVPDADEDPARHGVFLGRCREIAGALGRDGITLLLETGQESAELLVQFLEDVGRANLKVNFDPANMILYGAGDPIAAARTIGNRIGHVHIKDATASSRPGVEWGEDVPVGAGAVPWPEFLRTLEEIGYRGALAIEREAGEDRLGDVAKAIGVLQTALSR